MNTIDWLKKDELKFSITEELKTQIKEIIYDSLYLLDAVTFVNKGLVEYSLIHDVIDHSTAFYLKSTKDKEKLLDYLQVHNISLLDFAKAYSEYSDEQDFVEVFPMTQELRFFDQHEITDFLQECIPYLVDVAYIDLVGNILEE